jgi:hypothetical protein
MNEAYGNTLFCEDIRQEVMNKLSLIGVLGHEIIFLAPFPQTLPKLGFHMDVRFPVEKPVNDVRLLIYFPGDAEDAPTINQVLPWKSGEPSTEPLPFPDAARSFAFIQHFVLSSVLIKQEGYIRVRIVHDEKRIRIGALKVSQAPPESQAAPTAPEMP